MIVKPWIYTTLAYAGDEDKCQPLNRRRRPVQRNTLGLLTPPSDIELQEECVQMEEIEMQHRIHQGETASVAEYERTRRHLKLTIGHDGSGGGMFLTTRRCGIRSILTKCRCRLYNRNLRIGRVCLISGDRR